MNGIEQVRRAQTPIAIFLGTDCMVSKLLAEVKGCWPQQCKACLRLLAAAKLTQHDLKTQIALLLEKAKLDAHSVQQHGFCRKRQLQDGEAGAPSKLGKLEVVEEKAKPAPTEAEAPSAMGQAVPAESELSKDDLVELHQLSVLERGTHGKQYPILCRCCKKVFCGRNRAKVWQHVDGQEHRAKKAMQQLAELPQHSGAETASVEISKFGRCAGLRLNGALGLRTRLGGDLRHAWNEWAAFADLSRAVTVDGCACHSVQQHHRTQDWIIRHCRCSGSGTLANSEESVCKLCFELASSQKFISKICGFVLDMDAARLLQKHMYASERVGDFMAKCRDKALYQHRSKASYEKLFAMPVDQLHRQVRSTYHGRMAHSQTKAFEGFLAHTVLPCIEVEPKFSLKQQALENLLGFMRQDPNVAPADLNVVRTIVTGQLSRHPALHGVIAACAERCQRQEAGLSTMRNSHRHSSARAAPGCHKSNQVNHSTPPIAPKNKH